MSAEMWRKISSVGLYISVNNEVTDVIEIFVTNFETIWTQLLTINDFTKLLKTSNPGLQNIRDNVLVEKGFLLLNSTDNLKEAYVVLIKNGILRLYLKIHCGYPLRLILTLKHGNNNMFFEKVTIHLLKSINDLKHSQEELCKLLVKKDKEIEEYKEEGGAIALRHLKTRPFNEGEHKEKHSVLGRNFDFPGGEVPDDVIEARISCQMVSIEMKPGEDPMNLPDPRVIKERYIRHLQERAAAVSPSTSAPTVSTIKEEVKSEPNDRSQESGVLQSTSAPTRPTVKEEIKSEPKDRSQESGVLQSTSAPTLPTKKEEIKSEPNDRSQESGVLQSTSAPTLPTVKEEIKSEPNDRSQESGVLQSTSAPTLPLIKEEIKSEPNAQSQENGSSSRQKKRKVHNL